MVIAGVRDPVVLRQHDRFLAEARASIARKSAASLGLEMDRDFRLLFRVYGKNGAMGSLEPQDVLDGHEVDLEIPTA